MKVSSKKQNEVWTGLNNGVDLKERIPQIVDEISKRCPFIPDQILSTSSWWNQSTGVGAFHFSGKFEGKPAVLKVQGVKPSTSEVYMINSFAKQNKSKIIRAPYIYTSFPWDDDKKYEAFILEDTGNKLVINVPTTKDEVVKFFSCYDEYRTNCISKPWLEKPNVDISKQTKEKFKEWITTSHKVFPNHPLRQVEDEKLILKASEILAKNKEWLSLEFMHGHFSAMDLRYLQDEMVILSNLYWSWRTPYYDLVFAYHWFMYDLTQVSYITPKLVEEQRKLWLDEIEKRTDNKSLLKYTLLERAAAGLNLDSLSMDTKKPIAKYLVGRTREILKDLIKELS